MSMKQNLQNMVMVYFGARGIQVAEWILIRNNFIHFLYFHMYFLSYFGDF